MFFVRRNGEMNKMNSVKGGREVGEDEAKKGKRETQRSGGGKILAPTLKLIQELSQFNQTGLISVNPKKKNDEISFGMD